jgi:protein transport protein SEC24
LFSYRNTCAATSPAGQLVLPESLKLFPLYTLGLLKSLCFRENSKANSGEEPDPRADERAYQFLLLQHASPSVVHRLLQPRLFNLASFDPTFVASPASTPTNNSDIQREEKSHRVMAPGTSPSSFASSSNQQGGNVLPGHRMSNGHIALPHPVHCSAASLAEDKVMLLDAGSVIYIWVGRSVDSIILTELFGVQELDAHAPPTTLSSGGEVVELIRAAIVELRRDVPFYAPLKIIVSGPNSFDEKRFLSLLIEDKTKHQISYVDFLCQIHRVIQRKM